MKKVSEQDRIYHRELIWIHLLNCFNTNEQLTDDVLLKRHKKYIDTFLINSKNKYHTVDILNNYLKNPNKPMGKQIFWNTISKKINV